MSSKNKSLTAAIGIFEKNIEGSIRKIPLNHIEPSSSQPRLNKEINIQNLARSLEENGLLQPIVVTMVNGKYIIIAGERRYRAAKSLNWKDIECRILNKNERDTYKLAVIENLQRENLDAFEESIAYKKLKDQFTYTDAQLSEVIGKSRNYVSELLSISEIPETFQIKAKEIGINSKNMLIQLCQALKNNIADQFLENIKDKNISSVKAAKEYIKSNKKVDLKKSKNPPTLSIKNKSKELKDINIIIQKSPANHLKIKIETPDLRQYALSEMGNSPFKGLPLPPEKLRSLEKKLKNLLETFLQECL